MLFRCAFLLPVLLALCLVSTAVSATPAASPAPQADISTMAGSMLMIGFQEASLEPDAPILRQIRAGHLGGVILFDRHVATGGARNVRSPDQLRSLVRALQDASADTLLVAVDQEGGRVTRLKPGRGFAQLPSAAALGTLSATQIREKARLLGQELRELGINVNLAPVADVNINPACPVIGGLDRSFDTDPAQVAQKALAFGQGLALAGVVPCLKHFPGHGSAASDSHLGLADITATWNERAELAPYKTAFAQDWPGLVLMGHLFHSGLDPLLPASLSPAVVRGLLRERLGWNGVVITDDLQMRAANKDRTLEELIFLAVEAGNDILIFGNNLPGAFDPALPQKAHAALMRLVDDGRISPDRLRESWNRIQKLKQRIAAAKHTHTL